MNMKNTNDFNDLIRELHELVKTLSKENARNDKNLTKKEVKCGV